MIKFFRQIRKNTLNEKNVNQYLIYAIGEIVLVVLGILIALSINNWNERCKKSLIEQDILYQLKEEYEFNLKQLKQKISMRNEIINASLDILKYIDNPEIKLHRDSLNSKIRFLNIDPTFDPIQNDLIFSGNIRYIKNRELKKRLSNWSSDVRAVQEMELQWQGVTTDLNTPFQIEAGILRDMEHENFKKELNPTFIIGETKIKRLILGKSRKSYSTKSILKDRRLEGLVTIAIRMNNTANLQSVVLKDRIEDILKLLNQELDE